MRQHNVRPGDRIPGSAGRRHAVRRPAGGEAAVVDIGGPVENWTAYREIPTGKPGKSYDSIAVVVGRKADARQPDEQHGSPRWPPRWPLSTGKKPEVRTALSRIPDLRSRATETANRAATGSVAVLKLAYDSVFNPNDPGVGDETDPTGLKASLTRSFEKQRRTGSRVLAVALIVGGGWATFVPLSGAVVIPGVVVSETNVKKVQHPAGGIISGISVTDGMHVREGDVLVRLDDTQVRSNFQVVSKQLEEIRARISRLTAERDGHEDGTLTSRNASVLEGRQDDGEQPLTEEASLFKARADARKSQRELLRSRIAQLNEQIAGLEAQIKSKEAQSALIAQELEGVQALYEKRLTPLTRLTSLQREAARLDGERGQLISTIAETRGKISESELQLVKLDQDFRADVMKDLREAQDKEAELAERVVAAKDQLAHIDLRAPATGIVHQLAVHTIGGVVTPTEVMMVIVPESDELQIDAKLPPNEIDQVHKGQNTLVRLSAFNQRTTPELSATVSNVSPDITYDQQTNTNYYTVRISLPGRELARLGERQLISGMPAEVFIQTGSRTMMSYLFKPINDQLHRMFRER